ncbi:eb8b5430-7304-452f-80fd-fe00326a02f7-CDS [Sclerotinia trifoliorum]|uniref:Eb8b5430-7304-452f-80fd-fe00326a02f7-CDS n=1 Tax=Sclerotinia trifoliorum TaxID=28548 RepID=A0A8H2VQE2_9HELO|nr:eb8b5430-7304-452f-80fd-fe00326a02f7-CDS [Sclerotinia trifoliorum]
MDTEGVEGTTIMRRRNGKRPSCEPCRKGKLACGHELPVCGRCVKRGLEERCWYHPAPMSRGRGEEGNETSEGGERSERSVVKRRRVGEKVTVDEGVREEMEDEGGDVAGLDSLAVAAAMSDGDREEENEWRTKHTKTNGDGSRNADNITTSRHDSLGRIFTTTAENQSTTKNPEPPSMANIYRSSRGCVSSSPHLQSYKHPLSNSQDQNSGKATMQSNLNGTSYPKSRRYWGPTSFGAVFRDGDGRVGGNDGERNGKKVGGESGIEEGMGNWRFVGYWGGWEEKS